MRFILTFILPFVLAGCVKKQNTDIQYFKLDGLNRLMQPMSANASAAYVHHALAKDGQLAPANDCGIGSLEDAARTVLVYLRHQEQSGDTTSRSQAKKLLTTIVSLQKPDGLFFDWLDAQGRPQLCNTDGLDGFGYPEVQAMRALAAGVKALAPRDREFAQELHAAFWRSFLHVDSCLAHYGNFYEKDSRQFPQWLPFRSSADAASELILAFNAIAVSTLNDADQTQRLERAMLKFAEGIQKMQAGDAEHFPYGAHLAFETYWHSWGNCSMQALALVGEKFQRQDFIDSAVLEADNFVPYLQKNKFIHRFNLLEAQRNPNHVDYFPQPPADIRPLVTGLLELSRVTGNRRYARRAGEVARWFRGENKAHEAVYVAKTGLAKDAITGQNNVTRELTAAATVEALLAILEVENNADSREEFYGDIENVLAEQP